MIAGAPLRPRHALFSLSDKDGAADLAKVLVERGVTIWATEGTAKALAEAGVSARAVSDVVGQGAWLGGRVKTLHPSLLGGVLARRDVPQDLKDLEDRGAPAIDLVVVTLYPFESLPQDAPFAEAVETVDVGGVTLLRAAAKNVKDVAVLSSPRQYEECAKALETEGAIPWAMRLAWSRAAFERTARYDAAIAREWARHAGDDGLPESWVSALTRARTLRYGENPHQEAALYLDASSSNALESVVEGKELSYNNLLDVDAALAIVADFPGPACAVVKHNEPAGVGKGDRALEAFERAFAGDALSAFGGVVAFNREVDDETATALAQPFLECVAAPSFQRRALDTLSGKKNLRLVRAPASAPAAAAAAAARAPRWSARAAGGGLLVQGERADAPAMRLEVVTQRAPSPAEMEALLFAWTVVEHARSNAIVIARADRTLGIGAGQTSRIDAVHVALMKARRAGHDTAGAVLASDGFFPFGDWVEPAREAGLIAAIQPGGSVRDLESIEGCNAAGIALVMTGRRLFRH